MDNQESKSPAAQEGSGPLGSHSGGHGVGGHGHGTTGHGHGVTVGEGFVPDAAVVPSALPALVAGEAAGQILFLDCQSGIAGDMTLAALIDLGVPLGVIEEAVHGVGLSSDVRLVLRRGYSGAIGSCHLEVEVTREQAERSYADIRRLLDGSALPGEVRDLSSRIFARLAQAEAEVHRTELDQVHFHEVGGVDAIVDIVGAAAAFCHLGARVLASPIPLGRGHVQCRHGSLPLPAPAALLCLKGVPTVPADLTEELVTPTGAAILAEVAVDFATWPRMRVRRVGWGAGTRGLPDRPNVLRAVLGNEFHPARASDGSSEGLRPTESGEQSSAPTTHMELRANLDDMTGEVAAHALGCLLSAGAVDAWIVPVTMKKGRPGMVLCALAEVSRVEEVTRVFFQETTTLGVRKIGASRAELPREVVTVETRFGPVPVKLGAAGTLKPELDVCAKIALQEGIPLRLVLLEVEAQGRSKV